MKKMHMKPYDITSTFCFSSWGFTFTFYGNKGKDGAGEAIAVVMHFDASWLDYIIGHVKTILGKQEQQILETRNSLKLP